MNDIVLQVRNISKKFALESRLVNAPRFKDILKSLFGIRVANADKKNDFWALRDVSFELKRGENLGIVGLNGAGKSTLLKILLGRLYPDSGDFIIRGKAGGLIELGAGFHPEQTGRKNIRLSASIMGIGNDEISSKVNEIIEFAELGEFIDMPVKTYSSGMAIRLGFSVAIHCVRDLIICDEILAVGDFEFKQKCYRKIHELKKSRSFVLVSHGVNDIMLFCDKAIALHKGHVVSKGEVKKVIQDYSKANHELSVQEYLSLLKKRTRDEVFDGGIVGEEILTHRVLPESVESRVQRYGPIYEGLNSIENISIYSNAEFKNGELRINNDEKLEFTVLFNNIANVGSLRVGLPFFDENGIMVIGPDTRQLDPKNVKNWEVGPKAYKFVFDPVPLNSGRFLIVIAINNDPGFLYRNHLVWLNIRNVSGEFGIAKSNVRIEYATPSGPSKTNS